MDEVDPLGHVRSSPGTARARRARPAGSPDRTRSGSGCPGWPNCEPGRSRTPSASTSRAANASIGLVAEQPREPDRAAARPDPREAVGATLRRSRRGARGSSATIRRDRARTRSRARSADQREDLRRRRRADRRVVLESARSGRAASRSRVASQPIRSPASANDFDITPSEMPRSKSVGAGRQRLGVVELEEAVDLVGEEVDPASAQASPRRRPLRGGREHPGRVVRRVDDDQPRLGPERRRSAARRRAPSRRPRAARGGVTSAPAARPTSYRLW